MEETAKCFQYHAGSIGFSVGRITGNVRCADKYLVEQLLTDVRFVFPYVNDSTRYEPLIHGCEQCLGIYDFST